MLGLLVSSRVFAGNARPCRKPPIHDSSGSDKSYVDSVRRCELWNNCAKEIYLDSDTKIALVSSAPSDITADWFLTNPMAAAARARINGRFGSQRMLSHAIFTPGQPGWLDEVERAMAEDRPDSFKGYTIGDNTHKDLSRYPWRLDDEKLLYPFYEKIQQAGLQNVCVHKGLFPPSVEKLFPHLRPFTSA